LQVAGCRFNGTAEVRAISTKKGSDLVLLQRTEIAAELAVFEIERDYCASQLQPLRICVTG
jgi:hypothetical protein